MIRLALPFRSLPRFAAEAVRAFGSDSMEFNGLPTQ
jgi:hypothetical protein